jgi:hypothetical protein
MGINMRPQSGLATPPAGEELLLSTTGISADSNADGAIGHDSGGNRFSGTSWSLPSKNLMSDNPGDDLITEVSRASTGCFIYDSGRRWVARSRRCAVVLAREWGNERRGRAVL